MSAIDLAGRTISLSQFATAIATCGEDVTIIGEGEPGIGKSAVRHILAKMFPDYVLAYIDCTLLDLGDFALPYVVEENGIKVTRFAPNARFRFHEGKPVIVMLDEIGKASKAVKNVLLTLMLEHRIGDNYLPPHSRVFGSTNLMTDGVGDMLEAHAKNRIAFVKVAKPSAGFNADGTIEQGSWGEWALANDIAPEIIAWVKQFPHCLESYTDPSQRENPYIFMPTRAGQSAFVSPRSLEKASHVAKRRTELGDALTINLLSGIIGESAARDMQAFFTVVDKMPTWDAIMADPATVKLPDNTIAKCICVFAGISRVDKTTLSKFLTYIGRMDKEWQALFAKSVIKGPKQSFVVQNKDFRDWALANQWLF